MIQTITTANCDARGCMRELRIPRERSLQPFLFAREQGWSIVVPEGHFEDAIRTYCPLHEGKAS